MEDDILGVVEHPDGTRETDYLYRVSVKGVILNEAGEVLLVKETGRDWWDLPGGGMDHGETIKQAIAREMKEEVSLTGDFTYRIIHTDEPVFLKNSKIFQIRIIYAITPEIMTFKPGEDGDEVAFMSLAKLREIDKAQYDYLAMILGTQQD